ncbi:MAG: AAA family ATPase [Candidatus Falkowbacteria bacterium]
MTDKKIILGLVGQMACGKGTITKYATEKYGASTYRFSTILWDLLDRLHIEVSRNTLQTLSTSLRQNFGEDILAKVMAEDVRGDNNPIIIIDGIRRLADIKYLKEMENFRLVRIVADPKIRFKRLVERGEKAGDTEKTFEEFMSEQTKEAEAEIPTVMAGAELEINNNHGFEELHRLIDEIINIIK